jgi:hypothetical protein
MPNSISLKLPTANVTSAFNTSVAHFTPSGSIGTSFGRVIGYLLALFIVTMVILLFVHYFIRPIFRLHPGDSGIITIPGFDDGVLYWNKGSSGHIPNKTTPIHSNVYNYTLNLDVFIENPLQFSNKPRIFFQRGGLLRETPTSDNLLGMLEYYNLVIALLPDTNDIIVSTQNSNNNMENIILPNVPIQEPFRLGVVLMENAMEVYLNGHLMKTRTFISPPRNVKGDIYGPLGINTNIVKVRNLKLWNRILPTGEIRYATPTISTIKEFNAAPMSGSSSCSLSSIENKIENRLSKLAV